MKHHFNILRITRNNLLSAIEGLSTAQLNKIPEGFSNNIIWNVAHNLVVQQLLIYRLSGHDCIIDEKFIEKFKKGTSATPVTTEEIAQIKSLLLSSIDQLEKDYKNNIFTDYTEYTTSYNITLQSTEDAIIFNNVHEGLHLGYIMAMKKLV